MTHYHFMQTPVGTLLLAASNAGLELVQFEESRHARQIVPEWLHDKTAQHPLLAQATTELAEYFEGKRRHFTVPLNAKGTEFQKRVWTGLAEIPYGDVLDYKGLAARIGSPRAVRAVGAANGRNPLPIVVPCHRVVGSNGSLTGFAGGLGIKRFLLEHEGALAEETAI